MYTELAKRLTQGDEQALYELKRKYEPWLSSVICNVSGGSLCAADIEELVADSFIELWMHRESIIPEKCKSFLCCIAKNKTRDLLRKQKGKYAEPLTEEEAQLLVYIPEEVKTIETRDALERALGSMEPAEREIMIRRYFYYQPLRLIAEKTELKESTVKSKLRRGLKKLREFLEKEGFDYE